MFLIKMQNFCAVVYLKLVNCIALYHYGNFKFFCEEKFV